MIIFGTTSTRKLLDKGEFNCPQCLLSTPYEKRRVKQWGHLYWIPIIPMQEHPPNVECKSCRNTFIERVLDENTGPTRAQFDEAATKIMASMILADGEVEDAELDMMRQLMADLFGREVERAEVDQAVSGLQSNPEDCVSVAQSFAPFLNPNGAEVVLRSAVLIAVSDGDFAPEEQRMVGDIGAALGLSGAHIRGIVEQTLADIAPPQDKEAVN